MKNTKYIKKHFYRFLKERGVFHAYLMRRKCKNDTIEHVLPQSKGNKDVVNLIGNLTLVQMNMNQKLSNKNFEEKKQLYKESTYRINRYFDNKTTWGEKEIMERTEHMAHEITQIWKV